MFKIPSYSDIEKNEKEISEKGAQLKLNLFQNKLKENDDNKKNEKVVTAVEEISKESCFKSTSDDNNKPTTSAKSLNSSVQQSNDLDDDDLLLCNIDLNEVIKNKKPKLDEPKQEQQQQENNIFKKPFNPLQSTSSSKIAAAAAAAPTKIKPITEVTGSMAGNASGANALLVNSKQRGNPILKYIRNVPWRYSDTLTPDYSMGRNSCALYLSMKYHLLNNEYIHERLRELGRAYELRVLLLLVDVTETKYCLRELEKICVLANLTLILAWSYEEAGRYLETYKAYENKSADALQEKIPSSINNNAESLYMQNFTDFICSIKSINKTDASTLRQTFGSLKAISEASKDELTIVPGFGPLKVNRIYEIFRTPFLLENDKNYKKKDD